MRSLQLVDIHNALKCKLVEVEAVAHIVVCRDGLRVVVYHYTPPSALLYGLEGIYGAPVKLYGAAYSVGARTKHNYGLLSLCASFGAAYACVGGAVVYVVMGAVVGEVEVVGLCRELCGKGIYLFYNRYNSICLSLGPDYIHCGLCIQPLFVDNLSNLEIGEALSLCSL